jgi:hypothetical protein
MDTPDRLPFRAAAPFLLAACFGFLHQPLTARDTGGGELVEVRGRILANAIDPADALLVVEVDGESCLPFTLRGDGRFTLRLPAGSTALLRFELEGCVTKEVVVDTRNAHASAGRYTMRRVGFDVLMAPPPHDTNVIYARPVGGIRFQKGSGLMDVRHDRQLVRTAPDEEGRRP